MIYIIAFVAIAFGYYFIQRDKIKKEARRERRREKHQDLLDRTLAANRKAEEDKDR